MRIGTLLLVSAILSASACAQTATLPLWPNGNPEPSKIIGPEVDPTTDANRLVSGKPAIRVTNISKPSLMVYPPKAANSGAAALVFPGGSYIRLSIQTEGTEVCDWLNSLGMTCILVKYRVPQPEGAQNHYPANVEDIEDAQQAMRLTRAHAVEWHIDPHRIGVVGFSAGAHLAVALSTHPDFQGKNVPASTVEARPNFQMVIYPGWLTGSAAQGKLGSVDPSVAPDSHVPPTFLAQAEDDYTAHVENALVYFLALKDAKVPAEMHLYTQGGHGFGMRPTEKPISHWGTLAAEWLHTIHILGPPGPVGMP
jgi:acetyl esterase/lipase